MQAFGCEWCKAWLCVQDEGGGMYFKSVESVTMSSCLFSGNRANVFVCSVLLGMHELHCVPCFAVSAFALQVSGCCGCGRMNVRSAERCFVAVERWWHVFHLREICDTDKLLVLREHCRKLRVLDLA